MVVSRVEMSTYYVQTCEPCQRVKPAPLVSAPLVDVDIHKEHLRKLLELMHNHNLYGSLKKCIFREIEILVLGWFVRKNVVSRDPGKVRIINEQSVLQTSRSCDKKVPWIRHVFIQVLEQLRMQDLPVVTIPQEVRCVGLSC